MAALITAIEKDATDVSELTTGFSITKNDNRLCTKGNAKKLGCYVNTSSITYTSDNQIVIKLDLTQAARIKIINSFSASSGLHDFYMSKIPVSGYSLVNGGSITEEYTNEYYSYTYHYSLTSETKQIYLCQDSKTTFKGRVFNIPNSNISFNNITTLEFGGYVGTFQPPNNLTSFIPMYSERNKDTTKNSLSLGNNLYNFLFTFTGSFVTNTLTSLTGVNKFFIEDSMLYQNNKAIYFINTYTPSFFDYINGTTTIKTGITSLGSGSLIRHKTTLNLPFTILVLEDFAIRVNGPLICNMINPPTVTSYLIFRSFENDTNKISNLKLTIPKGTKTRYLSWINALGLSDSQISESIINIPLQLAVVGYDYDFISVHNIILNIPTLITTIVNNHDKPYNSLSLNVRNVLDQVDIFEYVDWLLINGKYYHRYRNYLTSDDSYDILIKSTTNVSGASLNNPQWADAKLEYDGTLYLNGVPPLDKIQIIGCYYNG